MSSIAISGNAGGIGVFTLASPSSSSNYTLTLPEGTGTLTANGVNSNIVSGTAVATTSGTSIDFTSIPSWVKRVTVMFNQISTNGSSVTTIRLGTSSGVEATGYIGSTVTAFGANSGTYARTISTGFDVSYDQDSNAIMSGMYTIVLMGSNIWTTNWMIARSDTNRTYFGAGVKTLSGTLTTVRLTNTNGTDTFDAGSINILYE